MLMKLTPNGKRGITVRRYDTNVKKEIERATDVFKPQVGFRLKIAAVFVTFALAFINLSNSFTAHLKGFEQKFLSKATKITAIFNFIAYISKAVSIHSL